MTQNAVTTELDEFVGGEASKAPATTGVITKFRYATQPMIIIVVIRAVLHNVPAILPTKEGSQPNHGQTE